ncbi:MAG: ABC-2 family transporter protein, partial [Alphaproteobacteria bacterium]|nr:ABC-2 family transporter protein [Alphaproteobacteria bacterium]
MSFRRDLGAAAAFAALGWRRAAAEPVALAGRAALYVVILAIFRQLWRATPLGELGPSAPTAEALLWYLAITEWIVFAVGLAYREVENDISTGEIASAMLRPLPYGWAVLARWAGATAFHLLILGGVGIAAAWWLTGTIQVEPAMAPCLLLAGVLAAALILLFHLQLGYAAAWLGSAAPAFWIWQKLGFVFGGLLMPLTLYPQPWGRIAATTPFAAFFFGPGSLALDASFSRVATVIASQLAWLAFLGVASWRIDRAASAR